MASLEVDSRMIAVAHCREATEAYLIQGGLASEGIPAVVLDEHLVGVNWLYSDAVGGVKVAVRPADEQRARRFLTDPKRMLPQSSHRAPGGARIAGIVALVTVAALAIPSLFVGLPLFAGRRRRRVTPEPEENPR